MQKEGIIMIELGKKGPQWYRKMPKYGVNPREVYEPVQHFSFEPENMHNFCYFTMKIIILIKLID